VCIRIHNQRIRLDRAHPLSSSLHAILALTLPASYDAAAPANDVQVRISGVDDVVAQLVREQAQQMMSTMPPATSYPNLAGMLQTTAENVMGELNAALAGAPPSALLNTILAGVRSVTGVLPPPPPPQPRSAVAQFLARFSPRRSDTATQPAATSAQVVRASRAACMHRIQVSEGGSRVSEPGLLSALSALSAHSACACVRLR
jgi:hypothetical protein